MLLLSSADFFSKFNFFEKFFQEYNQSIRLFGSRLLCRTRSGPKLLAKITVTGQWLLMSFADNFTNSLEPDQVQKNVGPDQGTLIVFLKYLFLIR